MKKNIKKFFVSYVELKGYATLYNFRPPNGNLLFFYQPPCCFCGSGDVQAVLLLIMRSTIVTNFRILCIMFHLFANVVRLVFDNIYEFKITIMTFETFDELSNYEFGMDYDQLGPNEKQWVKDELF